MFLVDDNFEELVAGVGEEYGDVVEHGYRTCFEIFEGSALRLLRHVVE